MVIIKMKIADTSLEELKKVEQSNKKQHLNSLHLNIQSLFAH